MASPSRFLNLPREIRDLIYREYVFEPEGYHFNYESGKLRRSNGQPIDLAFMYSCKLVAAEMRDVIFENNFVAFSTVYSERERLKAGYLQYVLLEIDIAQNYLMDALSEPEFHEYRTPELMNIVRLKYPQFEPMLERHFKWDFSGIHSGESQSSLRCFRGDILRLLSTRSDFVEAYIQRYDPLETALYRSKLLYSSPKPWIIPSDSEVEQMKRILPTDEIDKYWKRVKWRFSATAAAIKYLSCIPRSFRLRLRKLTLNEDRESSANPQCHPLGLIPYCLENPRLRVERQVNIWRNVMSASCTPEMFQLDYLPRCFGNRGLAPFQICIEFATWIDEALVLQAAGMPPASYSLLFDDSPGPGQGTLFFDLVKKPVAWQLAQNRWWKAKGLDLPWVDPRWTPVTCSRRYPQAIIDMIKGRSFISCTFPMGDLHDTDSIFSLIGDTIDPKNMRWESWRAVAKSRLNPPSPLPSTWSELGMERILPEQGAQSDNASWQETTT